MGFSDRAIDACKKAMMSGSISERHVRDVLKSKGVDGSSFVEYLRSDESMVRLLAARIIAEKGPVEELVKAAMQEKDRSVLLHMLQLLGKRGGAVEALEGLLASEDTVIRDAAAEMFRSAGKPDSLFPLIFNEDETVAERIKRWMLEQRKVSGS